MFKFQRYGYGHTEIKTELLNLQHITPRKDLRPDDAEYKKLRRSIGEFIYIEPIIWNKQTGNIMGGHQRLKAGLNKKIVGKLVSFDLMAVQERPRQKGE